MHKEDEWGTVSYFFKEMMKQREEYQRMEQLEREAGEAVRRCLEQ